MKEKWDEMKAQRYKLLQRAGAAAIWRKKWIITNYGQGHGGRDEPWVKSGKRDKIAPTLKLKDATFMLLVHVTPITMR